MLGGMQGDGRRGCAFATAFPFPFPEGNSPIIDISEVLSRGVEGLGLGLGWRGGDNQICALILALRLLFPAERGGGVRSGEVVCEGARRASLARGLRAAT